MSESFLNILGVRIHPTNINNIIIVLDQLINQNKKGYITVTGIHGIIESLNSLFIKKAHNSSYLTVPDGMPLVYIGKLHGFVQMKRCYGPDLMKSIMNYSQYKKYSHFFYGGKPGIAEKLKIEMQKKFPKIQILGTYTPPFRPLNKKEKAMFINLINKLQPNFIWVGLSTPKQELFMYEYLPLLKTNIMIGVGAAFDIHTGQSKSAPLWMQVLALEWFYRLMKEPRRLWKRYLINNPMFIYLFALQVLGIKKYYIEDLS